MADMNIKTNDPGVIEGGTYNSCPCIYLNDEQCKALGITEAPAPGTVYMLKVRAVATRVAAEVEDTKGDSPDISLTWQLTDIDIVTGGGKDAASTLYS